MPPLHNPLIARIGATGTGKSNLALSLVSHFPSEILNADAMQMYRGLPVLTNKPSLTEQAGVMHHLLDCIPLDAETWRVGKFVERAEGVIEGVRGRGLGTVVVGGTHYYVQGLLFKGGGNLLRDGEEDEREAGEMGLTEQDLRVLEGETEEMLEKLKRVDPVMAGRWHPRDRRKIRRSLEIWIRTGRRASEIYEGQKVGANGDSNRGLRDSDDTCGEELVENDGENFEAQGADTDMNYPTLIFWLYSDMKVLKQRLADRVDEMVRRGLIEEVEDMAEYLHEQSEAGVTLDKTRGIWVSIGFKEFEPYVAAKRAGTSGADELEKLKQEGIEKTKIATRQYAKRQVRWIRIKLWKALRRAGMTGRLVLLDVTDPLEWGEQVEMPARRMVDAFLKGEDLPDPKELSEVARKVLASMGAEDEDESFECRSCETCGKILQTGRQYEDHLRSNGHKKAVRAAAKRAARMSCNQDNLKHESMSIDVG
jgi:tRNA dimethylallyltransferase